MDVVTVDLLGELQVQARRRAVRIPGGKQRLLLAALAVRANRFVSSDELTMLVWGEEAPPSAATTLRGYVRRLRAGLADGGARDVVETVRGGYRLTMIETDVARFRRRCLGAGASGRPADELGELEQALALWRGSPLCDLEPMPWVTEIAAGLMEERLRAVERRLDLLIDAGEPHTAVVEARALQGDHPFRESLWKRLMEALHADGRTAEALLEFAKLRVLLADELGCEPSEPLRGLHRQLLVNGPAGARSVSSSSPRPGRAGPAPARHVPVLLGRDEQLAALDDLVHDAARPPAVVLDGSAGVGKSALARRWAARATFSGGVVEVALGGVHRQVPVPVDQALAELLRALGFAPEKIPSGTAARRQLFTEATARRPTLVLLDDARDCGQVRPLLPAAGSLAVITSRSRLSALVLEDTARRLFVPRLTVEAAAQLIAELGGRQTATAEYADLCGLAERCEGIPLALRIAVEMLARVPGLDVRRLADALRDEGERLELLDLGDAGAPSVREVLDRNRRLLGPAEFVLLHQMARAGLGRFDLEDVRRLGRGSGTEVRSSLHRLVATNVVEQCGFRRFRLGELQRAVVLDTTPPESTAGPVGVVG